MRSKKTLQTSQSTRTWVSRKKRLGPGTSKRWFRRSFRRATDLPARPEDENLAVRLRRLHELQRNRHRAVQLERLELIGADEILDSAGVVTQVFPDHAVDDVDHAGIQAVGPHDHVS